MVDTGNATRYPNIRWAPDRESSFEFRQWAERVCTTDPHGPNANKGVNGPLSNLYFEARLYGISVTSAVLSTLAILAFKRGNPQPFNLLIVGPRNEFETVMDLAEWNARKHFAAESSSNSTSPGINGTLLANAGNGVWHRHLSLSEEKPTDGELEMVVQTVQGEMYVKPDLPDNVVTVRSHLPDFDMEALMEDVDAAVFTWNRRSVCRNTPNGRRLRHQAANVPFSWAILKAADNNLSLAMQMSLVGSALSDYDAHGHEASRIAVVGASKLVDALVLSTLRVWNTHIPAYMSSWRN